MFRAAATSADPKVSIPSPNRREVPVAVPPSVSASPSAAASMSPSVAAMPSASATEGSASRPMVCAASPIELAAQSDSAPASTASATSPAMARMSQTGVVTARLVGRPVGTLGTAASSISAAPRSAGSSSPG